MSSYVVFDDLPAYLYAVSAANSVGTATSDWVATVTSQSGMLVVKLLVDMSSMNLLHL